MSMSVNSQEHTMEWNAERSVGGARTAGTTAEARSKIAAAATPPTHSARSHVRRPPSPTLGCLLVVSAALWLQMPSSGSAATSSLSAADAPEEAFRELAQPADSHDGSRLRKRHSNDMYLQRHLEASAADLEWENPCGGVHQPTAETPAPMHFLKLLRRSSGIEVHALRSLRAIDTSDLSHWELRRHNRRSLPKLRHNSTIALRQWYRHVQRYVAAIAYLGRAQYSADLQEQSGASSTSHELNSLLLSARRMLCELEATINGSFADAAQRRLPRIGRDEMNRRLRATGELQHSHRGALIDVDLKFVKQYYKDYVTSMWEILRRDLKCGSQSSSSSSSSSREHRGCHDLIRKLKRERSSSSRSALSASDNASDSASASAESSAPKRRGHSKRRQQMATASGKSAALTYAF